MTDVEPGWLNQVDAAAHLSISTRTLRTWTAEGIAVVHTLPGNLRRYKVAELDQLATCERQAG